jgi:hypothetical protein
MLRCFIGEPDYDQRVEEYKEKKAVFFRNLEEKITDKESKLDETLDCSDFALTKEDLEKLAALLKRKPTIKKLFLSYNEFGNEGMDALSDLIVSNKNLKEIWLEYNEIDNNGLLKLINNPDVKERLPVVNIHLASNRITDDGYIAASKVMSPLSVISIPTGNIIRDGVLRERIRSEAEAEYDKQANIKITASHETLFSNSSSDKSSKENESQQNKINKIV